MRGFTLVEMLVVLVIVALASAVVVPRLPTMGTSLAFALNRQDFEQAIAAISYQSYRDSQDLVLSGTYTDRGRLDDTFSKPRQKEGIDPRFRARSPRPADRDEIPPANPALAIPPLPAGWRLTVTNAVYYRSSGYCSGGQLELNVGGRRYDYVLNPPLCLAQLVE